jgi:hypothetical protein
VGGMKGLTTYTASPSSPEDLTGGLRACSIEASPRETREKPFMAMLLP